MPTSDRQRLDAGAETAQSLVTARLAGDRRALGDLAAGIDDRDTFAALLAAVDLVCFTHNAWAKTVGLEPNRAELWQALMLDAERWRADRG